MMIKDNYRILAKYNATLNQSIYECIFEIPEETLWEDKGAFFGSILGTLNHLMVGDLIWLNRFNLHPNYPTGFQALQSLSHFILPEKLNQTMYTDKYDFFDHRQILDEIIIQFIEETNEEDYLKSITYRNTKGKEFSKSFAMLLQHIFNHQTHHRGQITTLLAQMGLDVGETDLLMLIPV